MIRLQEVIVVEGRYDKNALSQVVDAMIVETSGFGVFHDEEKRNMIRALAEKNGVVILTDSDGAGLVIRNYLKSFIPPEKIKNAYIPEIQEKREEKTPHPRRGCLAWKACHRRSSKIVSGRPERHLWKKHLPYSPLRSQRPICSFGDWPADRKAGIRGKNFRPGWVFQPIFLLIHCWNI